MRFSLVIPLLLFTLQVAAQPISDFAFDKEGETVGLQEWMAFHQTPGLSYYLNYGDDQSISWQTGVYVAGGDEQITAQTIFPLGAMSKAPLALLTLKLVTDGKIALDGAVNSYLHNWKISGRKADEVSIRDLLLGKKRWGSDYKPAGYAAGQALPSLLELLEGDAPSVTGAIKLKGNRGANTNNEYGNWLILQQLVEDQLGGQLPELAQEYIFEPLGMHQTFYATELKPEQAALAPFGHEEDGSPLADQYLRYPELCAAGLWSTPADFAKLVRYVQAAADGNDNRIINAELAQQGLEKQYGFRSLIFHINEYGDPYWGGNCRGFYGSFSCSLKNGWLAVAFSNRQLNWQVVNWTLGQANDWVLAQQ